MTEEETPMIRLPQSNLHLQQMFTDSLWGEKDINPELRKLLSQIKVVLDEEGNPVFDEEGNPVVELVSEWDALAFLTRDLRLGNLLQREVEYCEHYLLLAHDLFEGFEDKNNFKSALVRAAVPLELSQSKGGFLRKESATLRNENTLQELEPPKRSLLPRGRK